MIGHCSPQEMPKMNLPTFITQKFSMQETPRPIKATKQVMKSALRLPFFMRIPPDTAPIAQPRVTEAPIIAAAWFFSSLVLYPNFLSKMYST